MKVDRDIQNDRRNFPRIQKLLFLRVCSSVEFRQNGFTLSAQNDLHLLDVSLGGVKVGFSSESFKRFMISLDSRKNVVLEFKFPNSNERINLNGHLVWSDTVSSRAGFAFEFLNNIQRQKLTDVLYNDISESYLSPSVRGALIEETSIDTKFISAVKEFRLWLISYKNMCDNFDARKPSDDEQIKFIQENKKFVFGKIDYHFSRIWKLVKHLEGADYQKYQKFFQVNLLQYFIGPDKPLNEQIYRKPLGYAGDYIVMNYLYEDGFPGTTTFGKMIDRYTLSVPIARAHVNRRNYLAKMIMESIQSKSSNDIQIASIACGPALEILDLIGKKQIQGEIEFVCLDAEQLALDQIDRNLGILKTQNGCTIPKINLVHTNILSIVRKNIVPNYLKNLDLIYGSGFLDYLTDRTAERFIDYLFGCLNKGGTLFLANIAASHDSRAYLEMLGEWYLHHRTPEDMLKLACRIKGMHKKDIEFEPETKMNIYLKITKC